MEPFAIEPVTKIEGSIAEIKETFEVGNYLYTLVFELLVLGLVFVIEIQLVAKAAATPAYYTYTQEVLFAKAGVVFQFNYFFFGLVTNVNHNEQLLKPATEQ